MYGTVDAPLRFFKTLSKYLIDKIGLTQCLSEPCLFFKKDKEGKLLLIVVTFVDDILIAGTRKHVDQFKEDIQQRFKISDLGPLKKHLGIWYKWMKDENNERYLVGTMDKMVQDIIDDFVKHTGHEAKISKTPASPGSSLIQGEDETMMQAQYMSMVGKLMYLITKILGECANSVRELAKFFGNPGPTHWAALEKLVGYIKYIQEDIKVTYRKPKELRVINYVDSNFSSNKDDRKSITGMHCTLGGTLTGWASRTQKSVTLSSTEAEYVALATCCQDARYVQQMV